MFNDSSCTFVDRDDASSAPAAAPAPTGGRLDDALARRLPAHVSLSDLISAGMLGVVESFARYDGSRAETLDAYLDHRIRGALLDELRRHDPLTRAQRSFARQLTRAASAAANSGAGAGEASLAAALGLELGDLREKVSQVTTAIAIDGQNDGPAADEVHDYGPAPDDALDARQQRAVLAQAAAALSDRDRELLSLHYEDGQTMREIGARLGVSESRVSQLHARAIARLRETLAD